MKTNQKQFIKLNTGSVVKAATPVKFEGYLVRFGSQDDRDLDNEWFSKNTYFMLNAGYPVKGVPVNYHHGMIDAVGSYAIGMFDMVDVDDIGLFVQGQLRMREDYIEMLKELGRAKGIDLSHEEYIKRADAAFKAVQTLMSEVPMQFSMGADAATYKVNKKTGHIEQCGIVHGALTPTPADNHNPLVRFKNAIDYVYNLEDAKSGIIPVTGLRDTSAISEQRHNQSAKVQGACTDHDTDESLDKKNEKMEGMTMPTMEDIIAALRQTIDNLAELAGMELTDTEKEEMVDELKQNAEEELEGEKAEDTNEEEKDEMTEEELVEVVNSNLQKIMPKAIRAALEAKAQNEANNKAAASAAASGVIASVHANAPRTSYKSQVGGYAQTPRISVGEEMKYAHLTPDQMSLGLKLAYAGVATHLRKSVRPSDLLSEGYVRTMAHKIAAYDKQNPFDVTQARGDKNLIQDRAYLKSIMPFKADELDSVAITNQGAEWAFVWYDTRLWERVRFQTELFNRMSEKGMRIAEVTGKTMNVKLDTGSGTVYTAPEARSIDATGRPEVIVQTTPFTTDEKEVDVKKHMLAHVFSDELDEDSIINIQQYLDSDMMQTLQEAIESAFINGDTTITSSNINTDSTPASGIQTPLYIAFDGMRHNFLVDNTEYGNPKNGVLSALDYQATIALLRREIRPRLAQMLFVVDYDTYNQTLRLPEVLTAFGGRTDGTVYTGRLDNLFGVDLYTSGFLTLSQADGTISDTTGNNTEGTIMCLYAPYFQYGRKREVSIELEHYAQSGATVLVASVRHALALRSASAVAGTYDITVSTS